MPMWCMDQCFSLYNSLLCMRSSQALKCFQCLDAYPNLWITFYSLFFWLVDIFHRLLYIDCVKIWSFELLIFEDMTLVEFMQMNSCQFTPDFSDWIAYCAPLIPWFWTFSCLCASNVCTPFRYSYAFYAKIYNICWYQYHRKIMLLCGFHWHSRYSIWISTFALLHCVWFSGSSCVHKLLYLILWHDKWFIASRLAWMPNVHFILG